MKRFTLVSAAAVLLMALPLFAQEQQADKSQTITLAELRDHMFFLASDFLGGRVVNSPGYKLAAEYCASQFRAAGLEALVKDAEGGDCFLQHVPLVKRQMLEAPLLFVNTSAGQRQFVHEDSFKLVLAADLDQLPPVVFVGYGIEEPDHGWNDFEGLDVEGKTVLLLGGAPMRDGEPVLPGQIHATYASVQGAQQKAENVLAKGPAAIVFVADRSLLAMWQAIPSQFSEPSYSLAGGQSEESGLADLIPTVFVIKPEVAEVLFAGQRFDPTKIGETGLEGYECFELEGAGMSLAASQEAVEEQVESWNVVGIVRGTDPELADEYVTLGAHLDHIPEQDGQVCNGADDNASGSIGVLEVAEAVAMAPPRRSVIFILYAAEEVGLYGSRYFLQDCPVPVDSIIANVNLDMIGRTVADHADTRAHIVVAPAGDSYRLWELVSSLNERNSRWPLVHLERLSGGSSDHANYLRAGIPAVFFYSGHHQDLHRPTDDAEKIEYDKMQAISRLVYDTVMELGNREEPLSDLAH